MDQLSRNNVTSISGKISINRCIVATMQVKNCECKYNITSISGKISIKQILYKYRSIISCCNITSISYIYIYINRYIPLEIIFDGNTFFNAFNQSRQWSNYNRLIHERCQGSIHRSNYAFPPFSLRIPLKGYRFHDLARIDVPFNVPVNQNGARRHCIRRQRDYVTFR